MSKIPEPLHSVAALIDQAHEAKEQDTRSHLGASVIGHKCERFIWLSFRWAFKQEFPGRILRLFRRGHLEEKTVYEDLRLIGCNVSTINPETGKQWNFHNGHFGGSCDGIITNGLPEAPKTPHVLEIKTHSLKSFNDVQKLGVKQSKPQHWAQMQVYMAAFDVDRALYFAVCKDDDKIYTERVERDSAASMQLFGKAHRLTTSDRIPAPISADPSWFECKFCAAHNFCHESKLTKEVNCRTCAHSTPERDGRWACAHWDTEIPDAAAQRAGCDSHILHPDLVPWQYRPTDTGVIWLTPAGEIAQPEVKSVEIVRGAHAS